MSYILDALKKSAKERRRGSLPDMLTVQDIVVEKPKKRLVWPYLLAAALLLNAGVLIWWLAFPHADKTKAESTPDTSVSLSDEEESRSGPSGTRSDSGTSLPDNPGPGPVGKAPSAYSADRPSEAPPDKAAVSERAKESRNEPAKPVYEHAATDTAVIAASEGGPARQPHAKVPDIPSSAGAGALPVVVDENKIYRFSELPSSIRQDLPALTIAALLYSNDPAARMASINGQMMHEGQNLEGGLRLEEITRDGVVLRHRNIRFRVEIK